MKKTAANARAQDRAEEEELLRLLKTLKIMNSLTTFDNKNIKNNNTLHKIYQEILIAAKTW